jgi:tRNA dimethylallyltransferase
MANTVLVILGPTCTGKTALALKLCPLINGVILSADSRQVVQFLDIGTGKLPAGEVSCSITKLADRWVVDGVDIFGYDLVQPDEYFSAYAYVQYCRKLIPALHAAGKTVLVVGGTGLYIDALTGRISLAHVRPDMALRQQLAKLTTPELAHKLGELDAAAAKTIDLKNPARVLRAIEKCLGEQVADSKVPVDYPASFVSIGLTADREVLYGRADRWVETIFTDQLFAEVQLVQAKFPQSHRLTGLVYTSAVAYLAGELDLAAARHRASFDLHAYIRRQQTWFKRTPRVSWLTIGTKNFDSEARSIVESLLHG